MAEFTAVFVTEEDGSVDKKEEGVDNSTVNIKVECEEEDSSVDIKEECEEEDSSVDIKGECEEEEDSLITTALCSTGRGKIQTVSRNRYY